jgi:voltage-gated potassium channel
MADTRREVWMRWRTIRQLDAWLETPMIVLSFLWLVVVIVELVWGTSDFLELFGTAIWAIFFIEFGIRFTLAPGKLVFLRRNWLTSIALIVPAFRMLRVVKILRLARAARGLRLVRIVGTANRGMNALRKSMAHRGFGYAMLLTLLIALLGAAGMWALEGGASDRPFLTYGDALWWTAMVLVTMGTDFWPQTPEGRVLCLLLALYGFAMFGYITATIATFFLGQERTKEGSRCVSCGSREVAGISQSARKSRLGRKS